MSEKPEIKSVHSAKPASIQSVLANFSGPQPNLSPKTPRPTKYFAWKQIAFWVVFTCLIFALGIAFFHKFILTGSKFSADSGKNSLDNTLASVSQPTPNKPSGPKEQLRTLVSRKSRIALTPIADTNSVEMEAVPPELQKLILTNAEEIKIEKISFLGGWKGFNITYHYPEILENTYALTRNSTSLQWKTLVGLRAELAALLEVQNNLYEARFAMTSESETATDTSVSIIILEKQQ